MGRLVVRSVLPLLMVSMLGCGGGGGSDPKPSAQPTTAVVKVGVSGALPQGTLVGSVDAMVLYPTSAGLSVASADVAPSGAATTAGTTLLANPGLPGKVKLGLTNVSGIAAGEFVTLVFRIAAGNTPGAADFSISSADSAVNDTLGHLMANQVAIVSVSLQ